MKTTPMLVCAAAALAAVSGGCCNDSYPESYRFSESPSATPSRRSDASDWRQSFSPPPADLSPSGASTFFILEPGTVRTYRGGQTVLTITVLDETRVIDGVTTRVVEEREEEGGTPKEISHNFFAMDRRTGDVYYFGEDVDVYENARVATHPGVWHSGVNGARFGLAIASHPRVGDRYYQEVAPGVAMDRAEVVSVDERVQTPAGVFEHCVHVKETTPLEKDVGHKWYAPGVGLIKDGNLELVSAMPARR